jgi:hypothetical protein
MDQFVIFAPQKTIKEMCKYTDIEAVELPNGKTVNAVNDAVRVEVERIYFESWMRGVSVPFFDDDGTLYLANPDGSEDKVTLDRTTRTYNIIMRTAQPGCGRFAYLMP